MVRYLIGPTQAGQRLDVALAGLTGLSRRRARAIAEQGLVWLNQAPTRILSRSLLLADVVDVLPGIEVPLTPASPAPDLPVLWEDAALIVVGKPAGIASQSPRQRRPGELTADELVALQLAWREGRRPRLFLVHRLDRLTTGALAIARTSVAARSLGLAWSSGTVDKRYLVVVHGSPVSIPRQVDGPLGPDPMVPGRFRVTGRGRPASTELEVLQQAGGFTLLGARPLTGRTHQVRVHLAHVGLPVAGDSLYGGAQGVPRPFLHAWELALPHPATRQVLRVAAPLPGDMAEFLVAHGLKLPGANGSARLTTS